MNCYIKLIYYNKSLHIFNMFFSFFDVEMPLCFHKYIFLVLYTIYYILLVIKEMKYIGYDS